MLPFTQLLKYGNKVLQVPKYQYNFGNSTATSTGKNTGIISSAQYITVPVSGYTTGIVGAVLTFPTNITLGTGDYYMEALYYNNNNVSGYNTILTFNQNTGFRYGDSGYGNRIQYANDAGNQALQYAISNTRSSTYQTVLKLRFQRVSGISKIYLNDVQTNFAIGTSTTYNNTQISDTKSFSGLTSLNLGSSNTALISFKLDY